jgi:hypothetical protein
LGFVADARHKIKELGQEVPEARRGDGCRDPDPDELFDVGPLDSDSCRQPGTDHAENQDLDGRGGDAKAVEEAGQSERHPKHDDKTSNRQSVSSQQPVPHRLFHSAAGQRRAEKGERRHEEQRGAGGDGLQGVWHAHARTGVMGAHAVGEPDREGDEEDRHEISGSSDPVLGPMGISTATPDPAEDVASRRVARG